MLLMVAVLSLLLAQHKLQGFSVDFVIETLDFQPFDEAFNKWQLSNRSLDETATLRTNRLAHSVILIQQAENALIAINVSRITSNVAGIAENLKTDRTFILLKLFRVDKSWTCLLSFRHSRYQNVAHCILH